MVWPGACQPHGVYKYRIRTNFILVYSTYWRRTSVHSIVVAFSLNTMNQIGWNMIDDFRTLNEKGIEQTEAVHGSEKQKSDTYDDGNP